MPGQERCRCHNRGQFVKHTPTQSLGPDGQASTLVVAKPQSLTAELLAQHAVLFLKVVDGVLLLLVQPAGQANQQQTKRIEGQAHE